MQFDWDAANIAHIARHNIKPDEVEQVVHNNPIDLGGVLRSGEQRTLHLGETDSGRILFVVVTERNGMCRVVTARSASRDERTFHSKYKAAADDQDPTDP